MRSTKVKALSVGGRRKIYYAGNTVSEDMFPKDEFDKLIEKGFLHPVGEGVDDGRKPDFDQDEQPETRFGSDIKPQLGMPGMMNPTLSIQQTPQEPSKPKEPTEPPLVPGTPGHESVKVQNDETGKDLSEPLTVGGQVVGLTEGEKKDTLKDQGYLEAQQGTNVDEQIAKQRAAKTIDEKIDAVRDNEKKGPQGSTNFEDIDKIGGVTVTQMKKDLKDRNIAFPANAKKDELFKLWSRGE
jgi:hypothetical protein